MTKKDFIVLAELLGNFLECLERDNPKFDRDKFLNALKTRKEKVEK